MKENARQIGLERITFSSVSNSYRALEKTDPNNSLLRMVGWKKGEVIFYSEAMQLYQSEDHLILATRYLCDLERAVKNR